MYEIRSGGEFKTLIRCWCPGKRAQLVGQDDDGFYTMMALRILNAN